MAATISYDADIVAWANEQARLIRAGRFDLLDLEHIAEEIEDVGKSEQRELANRMAVLLAHLLKWKYQPERRGTSWQLTIRNQRLDIEDCLKDTPSLKGKLAEVEWWIRAWRGALSKAAEETGRSDFPATCPWTTQEVLNQDWLPE